MAALRLHLPARRPRRDRHELPGPRAGAARRCIVDCGVTFDDRGPGRRRRPPRLLGARGPTHVAGVFVTHGHEDHIGAIPYLLRRFDVPVFGPRYALGLVRERAAEHEILGHVRPARGRRRASACEVGPLRGRADPRHALDRRRDGARHPHRRGPGGAHRRLQVRRRAARRRDVRRGALRGARRARACACSSATRRTSTPTGPTGERAGRGRRARGDRRGRRAAVVVGHLRVERAPPAHARGHRAPARAQARRCSGAACARTRTSRGHGARRAQAGAVPRVAERPRVAGRARARAAAARDARHRDGHAGRGGRGARAARARRAPGVRPRRRATW